MVVRPLCTETLMRMATVVLPLYLTACCIGCDPVTRVEQTVVLKVSPTAIQGSGDSISVSIREFHEHLPNDKFQQFNPDWENQLYPWTPAITADDSGRVSIVYGVTKLDHAKPETPPRSRDPLMDRLFRVRVRDDGGVDEVLLRMRAGEVAEGQRHDVTVESLSKSKYVSAN
jgi:hypothetical protein